MKILAIYKHYWPDKTPYAILLKEILEKLSEYGNSCSVYSAQPSYNNIKQEKEAKKEILNGVGIVRASLPVEKKNNFLLRLIHLLIYLLKSFFYSFVTAKPDLIIVNCHPPILMGLTVRAIKTLTKTPYIYHCQDIHPESSLYGGKLKKGFLYKLLKKIDKDNCNQAIKVVTLSNDMKKTLIERGVNADKIIVINNFILPYKTNNQIKVPSEIETLKNKFTVLFAGNIGSFQGLENIVEAAKILSEYESVKIVFMGEGSAKKEIVESSSKLNNVVFLSHQSIDVAVEVMKQSDLGIVSLKPNIYKVAYPSKTMMYAAAGCPILAIVEKESFLSKELVNNGIAYSCWPNSPQNIAEMIIRAYKDRFKIKSEKIKKYAINNFDSEIVLDEWVNIVKKLEVNVGAQKQ